MEQFNSLDWSQMPAMALLVIGIISLAYYTYKSTQVSATTQATAIRAGTEAVSKALEAMRTAQNESREFYVGKLEDMRSRVRLLEDRVRELEEQVDEKDRRVEELERENRRLQGEIDDLRRQLAETAGRRARREVEAA